MSGRELALLIRARKVSAHEVMAAHLKQIDRINPKINAIVAKLTDEECLALADDADVVWRGKSLSVPFTVCRGRSKTWKRPSGFL